MRGRTLRERALALIDIAHPECRKELVRQAKEANILYADQIYITETGHFYPEEVSYVHDFKDGLTVHFRPIKPSDEENMRRLFYGSSDKAVYFRYFSPIKEMPHKRMQEYTNVDYTHTMSIVGVVEESGTERIVAEGRYVRTKDGPTADLAIIVDENLHGIGIGTFLLKTLIKTAKGRGIEGFTANVLTDNKPVMRIFEKSSVSTRTVFKNGLYELTISFYDTAEPTGTTKESR
jgi:RimJ/RimL family protein N-acetyltransferase